MSLTVSLLSDEIYADLEQPDDISTTSIAYWLTSLSNIGKLNTLLDLTISIENDEFSPLLDDSVGGIYAKLYELDWVNRQIRKNLGAAAYSNSVISFKEDGRSVTLVDKNNVAKGFQMMKKDLNDELNSLIIAFKMNLGVPLQATTDYPPAFLYPATYPAVPYPAVFP